METPSPAAPLSPPVAGTEMASRPGALSRLGAGAFHVIGGFGFLLKRPSLWPLALLPAVLAALCLVGGLFLAVYSIQWVEAALVPGPEKVTQGIAFLLTLVVWIATLGSGLVLGLAVALFLSAPLLERLSQRVEKTVRGKPVDHSRGLPWEVMQSLRGTLYFLGAAPGVFLLGLLPVVGPVLAALWAAYALAFQQTDPPLSRRGMDFRGKRAWHRYWKLESLGFGLGGLVTLIVPLANFLMAPALTVGATLMVLELEDQLIPPDVTPAG